MLILQKFFLRWKMIICVRVLPTSAHALLLPRLRSPVGLKLGGHGLEAIALSIIAQLQAWRHGESA